MKNLFYLLMVFVVCCFLFISCGGKKANSIIGKWEITKAEGSMSEMNLGTIYEFTDETNMVMEKSGFKNKATYKLAGEDLSYTVATITVKAKVKIDGDKMSFEVVGADQKFQLIRK